MSTFEVKVPQLSESVSEATLLEWHCKEGEAVKRDDILIDIETDKVVLEIPSPETGVLTKILKQSGDKVVAGEVIAMVDTAAQPSVASASVQPVEDSPIAIPVRSYVTPSVTATRPSSVSTMPSARRMMSENNIPSGNISGTGRGGRITKQDVLRVLASYEKSGPFSARDNGVQKEPVTETEKQEEQTTVTIQPQTVQTEQTVQIQPKQEIPQETQPQVQTQIQLQPQLQLRPQPLPVQQSVNPDLGERVEDRVPMNRLRARIAERLLESQQTMAALTTFNEVNMQPVMNLRNKYRERFEKEHGVRLGFMSFFVKAVISALKKFPIVNASIDGNDIVYHGYYDIGIAIGTPRGLVVPILRNADQMSIAEIEKQIMSFGEKAREGKLTLEDLAGGTFSITNGGVFGSMLSTPIINPPQSAILGVHATKERVVVEDGQMVIRPMNYLALSYDHRLIDGREAVQTLVAIKDAMEDPARLLLDI